jgi:hypothetical protein
MPEAARFSFATTEFGGVKDASFLPMLPLTIVNENRSVAASGLVDSGSTVNVLPYQLGLELGLVWEKQTVSFRLSGNLAHYEARPIVLSVLIEKFKPVKLAFCVDKSGERPFNFRTSEFLYGI